MTTSCGEKGALEPSSGQRGHLEQTMMIMIIIYIINYNSMAGTARRCALTTTSIATTHVTHNAATMHIAPPMLACRGTALADS